MSSEQLATILDFNGMIGVRLGSRQIQPCIVVYSKHYECLDWLHQEHPEFSRPHQVNRQLFMSQIFSLKGVRKILSEVLPYLQRLTEVGELALALCESRLKHPTQKYNLFELQKITSIVKMTSRPFAMKRRLEVLEKWL